MPKVVDPKPRVQKNPEGYTGNINLFTRPIVRNNDGSKSTVLSMSFYDENTGKETLIPMVGHKNGRPAILSEKEAINLFQATGKHLGKFNNPKDANKMAEKIHRQQEFYYG